MRMRRRQPAVTTLRIPRDSRSIPVADETAENNGTLYHCFWCVFTCNDQRDSVGGESTPNGVIHGDFTVAAKAGEPGVYGATGGASEYRAGGTPASSLMLSGINLTDRIGMVRASSDGTTPQVVVHNHTVSTNGGCPFCGCKNYKGDY